MTSKIKHDFQTFCEIIQKHKIASRAGYDRFMESGHPDTEGLPKQPQVQYKDQGYTSFREAANFDELENLEMTADEAKQLIEQLGIQNAFQWREAVLLGKINGPLHPSRLRGYSNDALLFNAADNFIPELSKAAALVQQTLPELKISRDWVRACTNDLRPDSIPSNPQTYYKKQWEEMKSQVNAGPDSSFWAYFLNDSFN